MLINFDSVRRFKCVFYTSRIFIQRTLICFSLLQLSKNVIAQGDFYNIDSISEIRLYFFDANWDHLLDSMYVVGEKDRVVIGVNFYSL